MPCIPMGTPIAPDVASVSAGKHALRWRGIRGSASRDCGPELWVAEELPVAGKTQAVEFSRGAQRRRTHRTVGAPPSAAPRTVPAIHNPWTTRGKYKH